MIFTYCSNMFKKVLILLGFMIKKKEYKIYYQQI